MTTGSADDIYKYTNFNSHAHVERDARMQKLRLGLTISTHTLTWSVTINLKKVYMKIAISTHTLTWSVTTNSTTEAY